MTDGVQPRPAPAVRACVAGNSGPLTLDGTRTYLVGEERCVLIDPGPAGKAQLQRLERLTSGRRVEAVCLTHAHADHAGAAAEAARRFGAPVAASPETLRRLGLRGRALTEGDEVSVDGEPGALQALEAPGHTADGLVYFRRADRLLFTGDTVLGRGTAVILHPDGRVGEYLATLARLADLRPSRILPGHGDPVDDPLRVLAEYRRHRLERGRQVERAVRAGARSVAEVRRRVYGELPAGLEGAAEASVRAHLAHLAAGEGAELAEYVEGLEDDDRPGKAAAE